MILPRWIVLLTVSVCTVFATEPLHGDSFASRFDQMPDRRWAGADFFCNGLLDWQIHDGRLQCSEGRPNWPVRTAQLLTAALTPAAEPFAVHVDIHLSKSDGADEGAFAGFSLGAGGEHVDYRITALTHHQPAEDGGILVVVAGDGRVHVLDFSRAAIEGGTWGITGPLDPASQPKLAVARRRGDGFADNRQWPVQLAIEAKPQNDAAYEIVLRATRASGQVISEIVVADVPAHQLEGGIGLVSHLGSTENDAGFSFANLNVSGDKVQVHPERAFGPIMATQYTLSRGTMKMTAQFPPLGEEDSQSTRLEIREADESPWQAIDVQTIDPHSFTATFRVPGWKATSGVPYRVAYDLEQRDGTTTTHHWEGTIRAVPNDAQQFVVAAFTGHKCFTGGLKWNSNAIWFPHNELVAAVRHHNPDFLFFSGDQVYEGDLTPARRGPPAEVTTIDYLYKWYRWCWAFRELTKDRPSVTIPDDHDVYHGNIWGAGGKPTGPGSGFEAQDRGGYKQSSQFVNAVHRTQVSHLPDPVDPDPIQQGISVYHTRIEYAGMSFAVIADRMFKSSPTVAVPAGKFVNGWPKNFDFDPALDADVPGAVLLGDRQLNFLRTWAIDWSDEAWMKVLLSQTIFANVATLPPPANDDEVVPRLPYLLLDSYPENDILAADADSNGWPKTGRDLALRAIRRGFALHIAGDQHLGSTIQYGVDQWGDAGYAICVPSIANTWPRRWFPSSPGKNRRSDMPRYAGDFRDGFGNLMTVRAVSNPYQYGHQPSQLYDRAPGYGIVRFERGSRDITIECWPRWVDPSQIGARQYPGWPITVNQLENYEREAAGFLPPIRVQGLVNPVLKVVNETTGDTLYALRIRGTKFTPAVFDKSATYTIEVGDDRRGWLSRNSLKPSEKHNGQPTIRITFPATN